MLQDLSFLIAFAAGVVSFISPCILPIIPLFLSFLGGASAAALASPGASRRILFVKTLFFVGGFSIIFVALGALFSSGGLMLAGAQTILYRIAGIIVVLFGVNILFDFWKALNIERRFHLRRKPKGVFGSVLLGLAFGAGWTPCVGPILASILFLAGTTGTMMRGMSLLALYSLGLGTPFLLPGLFFSSFTKLAERLRAHMRGIKIGSGIFLVVLGVLIFLGSLGRLNAIFFALAGSLDRWGQSAPAVQRLLFGLFFLTLAGLNAALYVRRVRKTSGGVNRSFRAILFPVPLALFLLLVTFSALSFARVLNVPWLISSLAPLPGNLG